MPLETATTIASLNPAFPLGSDPVASADDHIRLIKTVLKATFPNLTTPLTGTTADLNTRGVPSGLISMWSGIASSIPAGWVLCDGLNNTPDLRDRFIVGAGLSYTVAAQGGAVNAATSSAGLHNHTVATAGEHSHVGKAADHILTVDQIPAHKHESWGESFGGGAFGSAPTGGQTGSGRTDEDNHNYYTSTVGGNQAHSHDLAITVGGGHSHTLSDTGAHSHTVDTRSPYLALCFIMKV